MREVENILRVADYLKMIIQRDIELNLLQEKRNKAFSNFKKDFKFNELNITSIKEEFLEILTKSENIDEYYIKLTSFYNKYFKDTATLEAFR